MVAGAIIVLAVAQLFLQKDAPVYAVLVSIAAVIFLLLQLSGAVQSLLQRVVVLGRQVDGQAFVCLLRCAGILLVCGLILTIRKPAGEAKPFLNGKEEVKRFISIILVIAAYIVLMWLFGFLVPTLLVVCLLCFMFAEGKNIPKWQPIVYSIIVTGALYVAFVYMLKLRLPVGTLLDISL